MPNPMTICPPLPTNNTKQYDTTKSPLALLAETCRNIGVDTSSTAKSSLQSIDHTKKENGNHHLNKLHLNGSYNQSKTNISSSQLTNLSGYDGRRSGNSDCFTRGSVSPSNSLDKTNVLYSGSLNGTGTNSRPNSNSGNSSRPNSNNSVNSNVVPSNKAKDTKLSFKPYEDNVNDKQTSNNTHVNNSKRQTEYNSTEHLKMLNGGSNSKTNGRKSTDSLRSNNGLSPKTSNLASANCCLPKSISSSQAALNNYTNAQQKMLESRYLELQYQQYLAAFAASGYHCNSLAAAAAALSANPMLQNSNSAATQNALAAAVASHQQQQSQQQTHHSLHHLQTPGNLNCPPGCTTCIHHNPLLNPSVAASLVAQQASALSTVNSQTSSNVSSANPLNNQHLTNAHLVALSSQYPHLSPHLLNSYGFPNYPPLAGLTPTSNNATNNSSNNQTQQQNLPSLPTSLSSQHTLNADALSATASQLAMSASNSNINLSKINHICHFNALNGSYCGKRFTNTEEYLSHLKTHPSNEFSGLSSLDALYGSYEAMLVNPLVNLRRNAIHDTRFHPYSKPNYSHPAPQNSSGLSNTASSIIPSLGVFPHLNNLGSLSNLNTLSNNTTSSTVNNSVAAAAAAFNMYAPYASGRVGPTVQP